MRHDAQEGLRITTLLLREVLDGATYATAGAFHAIKKTGCEKRIKNLIDSIQRYVGIEGLDEEAPITAVALRTHKTEILQALDQYDPSHISAQPERSLSPERLRDAAARLREHSETAHRDVALLYTLFTTGAKPIEIARMEVRDYLNTDGTVREASQIRAEIAINRQSRPLYFRTHRARDALDTYLADRYRKTLDVGTNELYRGLDPCGRLFLTDDGRPFDVVKRETSGKGQYHCRGILDAYRMVFRRAGLHGVTTQSARRHVARRLRERGADDDQIGELLGIKDMGALRGLLARMRRPLVLVVENLL